MELTRRFTISLPDTNKGYCISDQPGTTVDPYAAGAITTTCRPMILSFFIFIVRMIY